MNSDRTPAEERDEVVWLANQIFDHYDELARLLGSRRAHGILTRFLRDVRPLPGRPKGIHDPRLDARLRVAWSLPAGRRMQAARAVAKACGYPNMSDETLKRHALRVSRRRVDFAERLYLPIRRE
jgi:hypothetical protein